MSQLAIDRRGEDGGDGGWRGLDMTDREDGVGDKFLAGGLLSNLARRSELGWSSCHVIRDGWVSREGVEWIWGIVIG